VGKARSTFVFDRSPEVVVQLASFGTRTRVSGDIPGVDYRDSDLDKTDLTANTAGGRGGFSEVKHHGKQRHSRRLEVAANAVRTVEDPSLPAIVSSTAAEPGLPAISSATDKQSELPAISTNTAGGTTVTKRRAAKPAPEREVDL